MIDMLEPGNAGKSGLQSCKEMEPWEIAVLPICQRGDEPIDVEHASDDEFNAWIVQQGVPVDNDVHGTVWAFQDRCGVINHAILHGVKLRFLEQNNSPGEQNGELFDVPSEPMKSGVRQDGYVKE